MMPPITVKGISLSKANLVTKRIFDLLVSGAIIIVGSPLWLALILTIKLTSPGPVFFRQERIGRHGAPFDMLKFRSMVVDAEQLKPHLAALNEQDGPAFKIRSDPRVTPLGRWLRKTSIDELPQPYNVLRGEMSLVGPRPLPCHESDACRGWHRRRVEVTPGLTCIWQISGRSRVTFAEWVRMDVRYMQSCSPWRDFVLLLKTVPAVLLRRGAS